MNDWSNLFFGDKAQVVLAGAAGGIVRWLTLRQSKRDGLVAIVVGSLCAMYLSPLVFPLLNPVLSVIITDDLQKATFGGFLVGIGGIGIVGFILDIISSWRRKLRADR